MNLDRRQKAQKAQKDMIHHVYFKKSRTNPIQKLVRHIRIVSINRINRSLLWGHPSEFCSYILLDLFSEFKEKL